MGRYSIEGFGSACLHNQEDAVGTREAGAGTAGIVISVDHFLVSFGV